MYKKFVADYVALMAQAQESRAIAIKQALPKVALGTPTVLLFSPHPDDECITGALPLRLMRQAQMRVVNVAITLGSKVSRQLERRAELINACSYIGYELLEVAQRGFTGVTPKSRQVDPAAWSLMVQAIVSILQEQQPKIIFIPHQNDGNQTHEGTHWLIMDALQQLGDAFSCLVIETEYWHQISEPNLMVPSSNEDVADLVAGIALHVGEIARNPYHITLLPWMHDAVRRGSEVIGGQGGAVVAADFATLYRVQRLEQGKLELPFVGGKIVGQDSAALQEFLTSIK